MNIKGCGSQPSTKGPAEYFTGTVRIDPLFQADAPHGRSAPVSRLSQALRLHGIPILSARP